MLSELVGFLSALASWRAICWLSLAGGLSALAGWWSLSSRWMVGYHSPAVGLSALASWRTSALSACGLSALASRYAMHSQRWRTLSTLWVAAPAVWRSGRPTGTKRALSGAHRRECLCNAMRKAPQCLQVDDSKWPNGRMTSSMTDSTMQINPLKRSTNAKTAGTRGSKARRCPRQENDGKTHTKVQAL